MNYVGTKEIHSSRGGKILQVLSHSITCKTQLHGCKTKECHTGFALVGTSYPVLLFSKRLQVLSKIPGGNPAGFSSQQLCSPWVLLQASLVSSCCTITCCGWPMPLKRHTLQLLQCPYPQLMVGMIQEIRRPCGCVSQQQPWERCLSGEPIYMLRNCGVCNGDFSCSLGLWERFLTFSSPLKKGNLWHKRAVRAGG